MEDETTNLDGSFKIVISDDKTQVHLTEITRPSGDGNFVTVDAILAELTAQNIVHGIYENKIAQLLTRFHEGAQEAEATDEDNVIAEGVPAIDGEDGKLEWHVEQESLENHQYAVRKGELIATYIHAGSGTPGSDVHGKPITPQTGRNDYPRIGANIETVKKDNKDEYCAKWFGVLEYESSPEGNILNIESTLSVTDDGMLATMTLFGESGSGAKITVEDVVETLEANKIKHGIDEAAIQAALEELSQQTDGDKFQENVLVAHGTPPKEGKDAELTIEHEGESAGKVQANGRMDFRERSYPWNVSAGEAVGEFKEAEPAIAGTPVWGGSIEVEQPKELSLDLSGLNKQEDGKLTAQTDGALIMRGTSLEIVELLVIDSDVATQTGNVKTHIPVHIKGHVEPGFKVESDKDVIIEKNVEDATIQAGQDVLIKGGIRGMKSKILSPGTVETGFIENAEVIVDGQITVNESIINSTAASNDAIIVGSNRAKRGAIMGGDVTATTLVQAKVLGTPTYAKTRISVGLSKETRRDKIHLEKEIEGKLAELAKLTQLENHLNKKPSPKNEEVLKKIALTREATQAALQKQQSRMEELKAEIKEAESAKVVVKQTVYPGVIITINESSYEAKHELGSGLFKLRDGKVEFFPGRKKPPAK